MVASHRLIAPLFGTAVLMAAYLTTRPYGDTSSAPDETARAFASPWWVASHLCGLLALAQFARLTQRLEDLSRSIPGRTGRPTVKARLARASGWAGALLVLPYFGAETFALHELGRAHLANPTSGMLAVTEAVRNHPVAMTTFGIGLISLAASGILAALAWADFGRPRWASWPLGVALALFLPQFFLPAPGRIAYGLAYAVCAGVWIWGAARGGRQFLSDPSGTVEP